MACINRVFRALAMLMAFGYMYDNPTAVSAQVQQYVVVTPDTLQTLAQKLKENLQDGAVLLADLHAMQLRFAFAGLLREDALASISVLEKHPEPDLNEPKLTEGLVPIVDKLIQELDEPNRGLASKYAEQLAIQVHAQFEVSLRLAMKAVKMRTMESNSDGNLIIRLMDCLHSGDIAAAVVLAAEVKNAGDLLVAAGNTDPTLRGDEIFVVNDALGRAAFLRQDYMAAGDYLLKAADTPGSPALHTFGPDFWLARALLQAGQRDVVLTFMERCKAFWPKPALDEWISVIKDGGSPKFAYHIRSNEPILTH